MINFEIHNHILVLDDLNLESSLSTLTSQDKEKLDAIKVLQVKEKAYFQRDLFIIFKKFIDFCKDEHNAYLILIESYPEAKSRIRTKKGLFYKHKSQFDQSTIFEAETEITTDQSLFAGIIRITDENLDYVVNRFDDLPIAFGLLSPKGKSPFRTNRIDFLEEIISKGLKPGKIYWKNWLKIVAMLVKPGKKLFSLQDLNDTEHFRVFYHKEDVKWEDRLKSFISQELQITPTLQN